MHGYGWFWPVGMMTGGTLLTLALVGLVVWLVVRLSHPGGGGDEKAAARRILAERYARGELDSDEYTHRLAALR